MQIRPQSCESLTLNAKVVGVGEVLLEETRPLLADLTNLSLSIWSVHIELHVLSTGAGEERPLDPQDNLILRIANGKVGVDEVKPVNGRRLCLNLEYTYK